AVALLPVADHDEKGVRGRLAGLVTRVGVEDRVEGVNGRRLLGGHETRALHGTLQRRLLRGQVAHFSSSVSSPHRQSFSISSAESFSTPVNRTYTQCVSSSNHAAARTSPSASL